jgi:hypothetical protein
VSVARSFVSPGFERAMHLTPTIAEGLPDRPGVYSAWITTTRGLRDAGIAGPAPVLLYVGRTTNLRIRLGNRKDVVHLALHELLASRGTALWVWGARSRLPREKGKRWYPSPFAGLALDQAADWQRRNVVWAWQTTRDVSSAIAREERAIATDKPFLNKVGGERQLAQLRRGKGYERARARWLWHMSWGALLFTTRLLLR